MMSESGEKTHAYPAGRKQIPGEENVHAPAGASQGRGAASRGGGVAHGFGHSGAQRVGALRMSGCKNAHRIGVRRGG